MSLNWLFQFLIFASIFFFGGFNAVHGLITLELPAARVIAIYGSADAGSYLSAATALVHNGQLGSEWQWVLNLWPPGMVWLDALVMKFSPFSLGVTVALISAAVWATCFSVLTWPLMRTWKSVSLVVLSEFAILATSPFQSWMLDEGLLYADGIASAAFILGLAIIVLRTLRGGALLRWLRDGVFSGISFAVAIYFRASYNLIPWVLVGAALMVGVVALVRRSKRRSRSNTVAGAPKELLPQAALLVVAAIAVGALMLPYSAYVWHTQGRLQFVQTEDLVYEHVWEDQKAKAVPQWMLDGGSTVGCDIDPRQCADFQSDVADGRPPTPAELRSALISAIITHPVDFIQNRVRFVSAQWFGDEITSYSRAKQDHDSGSVSYAGSPNYNPTQGYLYLALLLGACAAAVRWARRGRWAALAVPLSALALLAPFAIVHVEVRYLIPLKLIGLLAPMLVVAWISRPGEIAEPEETHPPAESLESQHE